MSERYRKDLIVVDAFQMTAKRRTDSCNWPMWLGHAWSCERETPGSLYPTEAGTGTGEGTLSIGALKGQLLVSWGDWIIRGVKGEIYLCKDEIFQASYDLVIEVSDDC